MDPAAAKGLVSYNIKSGLVYLLALDTVFVKKPFLQGIDCT